MIRSSDGQTMQVAADSPLRKSLVGQGFAEETAPATSAAAASASPTIPASNQPAPSGVNTTLYQGGSQNVVPTFDVDYWKKQGWSETQDAPAQPTQPANQSQQNTPVVNNTNQPTPSTDENGQQKKTDTPQEASKTNVTQEALAQEGIANLVSSGKPFSETDAKNFAYSIGESNWQKYVGGIGGQTNPLYIGSTNWANLQKQYTPYQLQQATIRTKDGIFWNENINIAEIPRTDPTQQINQDAATIANLVSDAKATADPYTKKTDGATGASSDTLPETPKDTMMEMLNSLYGDTAEDLYNELYNTEEITAAKADVIDYKTKLDEYEDQLEELKDDIRKEVEGEASASYISALATVRGGNILKLQKQAQRGYETALAILTNARTEANALLQVKMNDSNNRYNRMFSMLQLQIQQEGTAFNQQMALLTAAQNMPEGRSITMPDGSVVKGMKENDNLNVVQFTDASKKTYVIGVDKKTGQEVYRTFIGNAPASGGSTQTAVQALAEYNATQELSYQKEINELLETGAVDISYDEKGNAFYYDKQAMDKYNDDKKWFQGKKDPIDFRK